MRSKIYTIATNPLLLVSFLAFSFLLSFVVRAQGRAPAVLPEMGLSIEERRHIPPKEAKEFGFNFKEAKSIQQTVPVVEEGLERQGELEASTTLVVFAIAILALPIFLWFGLMKQLKKQRAEIISNIAPISLEEFRNKQEAKKGVTKKESKEDLPKAS